MDDTLDRTGVVTRGARWRGLALGDGTRAALASLSAAAGVIHLAMVPSHWGESALEGLGFVLAGWFQLGVAALILTRASRPLIQVAMLVNATLIAVWAYSRTFGLPFGAHAGHPGSVSIVDLAAVGFQVGFVVLGALAIWQVRVVAGPVVTRWVLGAAVPVAVALVTTAALASPDAAEHAATSHGDHGGGHAHASEVDDKGFSLLDNGQHAHADPQPLDAATQARLDDQLDVTREVAVAYPTVADAVAAGYTRVGPYFPGIGAHFMGEVGPSMNPDGVMSDEDLRNPFMLIFSGTEPDAEIAGFMYYSVAEEEPEGFVGGNDVWHYHENLCLKFADGMIETPYGLDNEATPEQCESAGGSLVERTQWMVHVWSVPGYEMSDEDGGVFGEANRRLTCPDDTYYMMPIDRWVDHPMNVCRSELDGT